MSLSLIASCPHPKAPGSAAKRCEVAPHWQLLPQMSPPGPQHSCLDDFWEIHIEAWGCAEKQRVGSHNGKKATLWTKKHHSHGCFCKGLSYAHSCSVDKEVARLLCSFSPVRGEAKRCYLWPTMESAVQMQGTSLHWVILSVVDLSPFSLLSLSRMKNCAALFLRTNTEVVTYCTVYAQFVNMLVLRKDGLLLLVICHWIQCDVTQRSPTTSIILWDCRLPPLHCRVSLNFSIKMYPKEEKNPLCTSHLVTLQALFIALFPWQMFFLKT